MRRVMSLVVGLWLVCHVCYGRSYGETWVVTYDAEDDEDRVGGVVQQAGPGDTILVEPGVYYEHISLPDKALVIHSVGGADVTILDGSRTFSEREGSILYSISGDSVNVFLGGFTLRNGSGSEILTDRRSGGAVCLWTTGGGGSIEIRDCLFSQNLADNGAYGNGGAIFVEAAGSTVIDGCTFEGNKALNFGGCVCIVSLEGEYEIRDCSFDLEATAKHAGAGVFATGFGRMEVVACSFFSEAEGTRYNAIGSDILGVSIRECQFVAEQGSIAARMVFGAGMGEGVWEVELAGNKVQAATVPEEALIEIVLGMGDVHVVGNTLLRSPIHLDLAGGAPLVCEGNIFCHSALWAYSYLGGHVTCNDTWPDAISDVGGNLILEDNISSDPLFCNEGAGDLRLAIQSPCSEENSPEGCGLMGALPVACDLVPVERISWGAIKAGYRE